MVEVGKLAEKLRDLRPETQLLEAEKLAEKFRDLRPRLSAISSRKFAGRLCNLRQKQHRPLGHSPDVVETLAGKLYDP